MTEQDCPFALGRTYSTRGGLEAVVDKVLPATFKNSNEGVVKRQFALVGRVRSNSDEVWRNCCWTREGHWGAGRSESHLDLLDPRG